MGQRSKQERFLAMRSLADNQVAGKWGRREHLLFCSRFSPLWLSFSGKDLGRSSGFLRGSNSKGAGWGWEPPNGCSSARYFLRLLFRMWIVCSYPCFLSWLWHCHSLLWFLACSPCILPIHPSIHLFICLISSYWTQYCRLDDEGTMMKITVVTLKELRVLWDRL